MSLRGVRGATTVSADNPEEIIKATKELLEAIMVVNRNLRCEEVASALFTLTSDLTSVHPARAAREMGWNFVPLMCAQEIPVPGSLQKCIRVLVHWNTDEEQKNIKHVYLHDAVALRPDLINN